MSSKEKVQCSFRLYPDTYDKLKVKVTKDRVSIQKLFDVLTKAYMRNHKEIMKIVERHADETNSKKRRYSLDEMESEELLRLIEKEYSPARHLEQAIEELKNE